MKTFSKKPCLQKTVNFVPFVNSIVHTYFPKKPFVIEIFRIFSSYSQL